MYTLPTLDEVRQLKRYSAPHAVTSYIRLGDELDSSDVNRLTFKHMVEQATKLLQARGVRMTQISNMLEPAQAIADSLWKQKRATVLFFMADDAFHYYILPPVEDVQSHHASVDTSFDTTLIEQLLQDNAEFLVLSLSHRGARLFEGDKYHLKELAMKYKPKPMREELGLDEYPSILETHSTAPADKSRNSEEFHGHYEPKNADKQALRSYFKRIDRRLYSLILRHKKPVLLAGVGYLHPIYKEVTKLNNIMPQGLHGNFDNSDVNQLHASALQAMTNVGEGIA